MNIIETRNIGFDFKKYNIDFIKNLLPMERLELFIILPNYSLLEEYRRDLSEELGGIYLNNIITLDDLAARFKDKNKNYISREESNWVIKKIIESNEIGFSSSLGSAKSILSYIFELKSSEISNEKLDADNEILREISFIYREYQDFLKEKNLGDEVDLYLDASTNLNENINSYKFLIYGFIEFRVAELKLVENLMQRAESIIIEYPFLTKSKNLKTENFLKKIKDIGFLENRQLEFSSINQEFSNDIFYNDLKTFKIKHKLIRASSIYYEVSEVFRIIKELAKTTCYSDISIIIDDSYEKIVKVLAIENNIPVSLSNAGDIRDFYLIRDVLNFLNFYKKDEKKYLINLVYDENFTRDFRDSGKKEEILAILRESNYQGIYGYNVKESELDDFILYTSTKLEEFKNNPIKFLKETYANEDFIKSIYSNYIENLEILANTVRSVEILEDILDRVERFSKILKLSTSDIIDLLIEILNNETYYGKTSEKSVKVLSPINSIGVKSKYRFILGLNYNYPKVSSKNIIDNKSLEKFNRSIGLNLESRAEKIDNIKLQFQEILASSNNYIFSYVFEDNELIDNRSFLLNSALEKLDSNLYRDFTVTSLLRDEIFDNKSKFIKDAYNPDSDTIEVTHLNNEEVDYLSEVINNEYRRLEKDEKYLGRVNKSYTDEVITYDATRMGRFNECPFHFYMKNELKYEPVLLDYDDKYALVKGNLYHKILEIYYKNYNDSDLSDLYETINAILKNTIAAENLELMDYQKVIIKNILTEYIINDNATQEKNKSTPVGFEKSVEYNLDKKIRLVGYIDRVDNSENGVILTDYKSTNAPSQEAVKNLEAIQLPIYRLIYENSLGEAVTKANYGVIESKKVSDGFSKIKDKKEHQTNLEKLIYKIDEKNRNGEYLVSPINDKVCRYCDYSDICRVGEVKIDR